MSKNNMNDIGQSTGHVYKHCENVDIPERARTLANSFR